jgi:serine/threonine protein kinase
VTAADPIAFSGTERFEIRRRIGAGAMGVVYEAFDHRRQMRVALKTIRDPAPAALQRFKREMRALAGVAHPNLVGLHELHCEREVWFFTMEMLDAVDLRRYVGAPCDEHRLRAALA